MKFLSLLLFYGVAFAQTPTIVAFSCTVPFKNTMTCTVSLNIAAPSSQTITLSSGSTDLAVPPNVTVFRNLQSVSFSPVAASVLGSTETVTLTATLGSSTANTNVVLTASAAGGWNPPNPATFPGNVLIENTLLGTDIATPANPASGSTKLYAKGGVWCSLSPAGTETCIGSGGLSLPVTSGIYGAKGAVQESIIGSDAYYATSINVEATPNSLWTAGGFQYAAYISTAQHVIITKITVATGALTETDTGFSVGANDEHNTVSLAVDTGGFIHIVYGEHAIALQYRRSTNPGDPTAWSSLLPMLGTHESSVTYPYFVANPTTGALYFSFRDGGSGNGDQYLYSYTVGTTTWAAATGTGSGGIFVSGGGTASAYLNGLPQWDSLGNLWVSWSWANASQIMFNQYIIKWTGSAFTKFDGSAQTIPVTQANNTAIATIATTTNLSRQNQFAIDSSNHIFIAYQYQDGNGNMQARVLESSTGSFVEHQLTNFRSSVPSPGTIGANAPSAVSLQGITYVVMPDIWGPEKGLVAWQSLNGFSTWQKFYITHNFNPNWTLGRDPTVSSSIQFLYQDSNDATYGAVYVYTGTNANLGRISLISWVPTLDAGFTKGVPQDVFGLNNVSATIIQTSFISAPDFAILPGCLAGIGVANPTHCLDIQKDQNASTIVRLVNANAGGSAESDFQVSNGTAIGVFGMTGTAEAAFGALGPSTAYLYSGASPGVLIMADHAAGKIGFTTGGHALSALLDATGAFTIKNGVGAISGTMPMTSNIALSGPVDTTNGNIKIFSTNNDTSAITLWPQASGAAANSRVWQLSNNAAVAGDLELGMSATNAGGGFSTILTAYKSGGIAVGTTGDPGANNLKIGGTFSTAGISAISGALPITGNATVSGALDLTNGNVKVQATTNDQSAITLWPQASGANASSRAWMIATNADNFGNFELYRGTTNSGAPGTKVLEILNTGAAAFSGPLSSASIGTTTNCSNAASPAVCGSAAAGAVAIPTGVTSVVLVVNTTAVTANSRISLLSDDSLTIAATTCNSTLATLVGGLVVTARTPGTSFTITYNGTIATNPLCVSYTIIN